TTWRKLPDKVKDNINEKAAINVMLENPSIIKRPVIKAGSEYLVGFDELEYRKAFGS
ncbi:MAG: ArsC/Spx/MgsR family protein, partial [Gammaproteobacteria bacterium]